jgi:hypothetical protein
MIGGGRTQRGPAGWAGPRVTGTILDGSLRF